MNHLDHFEDFIYHQQNVDDRRACDVKNDDLRRRLDPVCQHVQHVVTLHHLHVNGVVMEGEMTCEPRLAGGARRFPKPIYNAIGWRELFLQFVDEVSLPWAQRSLLREPLGQLDVHISVPVIRLHEYHADI